MDDDIPVSMGDFSAIEKRIMVDAQQDFSWPVHAMMGSVSVSPFDDAVSTAMQIEDLQEKIKNLHRDLRGKIAEYDLTRASVWDAAHKRRAKIKRMMIAEQQSDQILGIRGSSYTPIPQIRLSTIKNKFHRHTTDGEHHE